MKYLALVNPWWAALTVWGVVNAVNVLQAAGFLSRVFTGNQAINHLLNHRPRSPGYYSPGRSAVTGELFR